MMKRWQVLGWIFLMLLVAMAVAVATYSHVLFYGNIAGRWGYLYFQQRDWVAIAKVLPGALALAAIPLGLPWLLGRRWGWSVALALVCATSSHLVMRSVCRFSLADMVRSDGANSFWSPSQQYGAAELLGNFETIVDSLPRHAQSNMPGKILVYHALNRFIDSPWGAGVGILVLSNLGGLLLFGVVKLLVHDSKAAYGALLLYLFIPSRLYLLPTMNTLTPVLMLLPLLLFLGHLESGRGRSVLMTGVALYGLLLFEPLPFLTGLVFIGLLLYEWRRRRLGADRMLRIIGWTMLGFLVTHVLMLCWLNYDVFYSFSRCLADAVEFNERDRRPYSVWVLVNLKEFFLGFGGASVVLLFAAAVDCLRRYNPNRHTYFFVATGATLLVADLLGVNRGETMRLWIFLMVLLQVPLAYYSRKVSGLTLVGVACLANVLQTTVALGEVAFVVP